jgi:hypothetical protein
MKDCVSIVWVSNQDIARELYSSSGNKQELLRGNSWGLQVEYLPNIEVTEMNCGASGKFLSVGALGFCEEGFGGNICLRV